MYSVSPVLTEAEAFAEQVVALEQGQYTRSLLLGFGLQTGACRPWPGIG